jgi:hypothetical protein
VLAGDTNSGHVNLTPLTELMTAIALGAPRPTRPTPCA